MHDTLILCFRCLAGKPATGDSQQEALQKQRQQLLISACAKLQSVTNTTTPPSYEGMIADDDRRYIYCKVEKVSCTSWKRVLLAMTGEVNRRPNDLRFGQVHGSLFKKHLRYMSSYTEAERRQRLGTYYKFMFVREPLERLVSAYRDKIDGKRKHRWLVSLRNYILKHSRR